MGPVPPWVEIPRQDLDACAEFRLPIGFRLSLGIGTLIVLGLFGLMAWSTVGAQGAGRFLLYALLAVVALILAHALRVVSTFADRIQTTPEALRRLRPFGRVVALPWSQIDSVRARRALRRIDVGSPALARPIRLELQLEGIDELLMRLAERSFQLVDAPVEPAGDASAPAEAQAAAPAPKTTPWWVAPGGLESFADRIDFAHVADLRILGVGTPRQPDLLVAAQLRDGNWVPVHAGMIGCVEAYQRARRLHRDWAVRSEAIPPAPIPELRPRPMAGTARWFARFAPVMGALAVVAAAGLRNPEHVTRLWRGEPDARAVERAFPLFRAHRYPEVIALAEKHFGRREPGRDNLVLLRFQAESYRKLGRADDAIRSYERAVPVVRALDNVQAEGFAPILYELAMLKDAAGDTRAAVPILEEGLRLRPASAMHRALLAAWYQDTGDGERARGLFRELLDAVPPGSEPHAVAVRRLAGGAEPAAEPATRAELTQRAAIALVPLGEIDPRIDPAGICLVLETQLWLPCVALPPQQFPNQLGFDPDRNQWRAGRVLEALHAARPAIARGFRVPAEWVFVLGVTSQDLFDGEANFLFASSSREARVAVVSSYRTLEALPRYFAPEALVGRRLSIQALSAVGTGLGFERPISQHCPLAYPGGIEAFVLQRGALCAGTLRERDALLASLGGERMHHDAVRAAAAARTAHAYLLDPASE
jgi:tetratricopeptide (TPR) repeat protein